MRLWGKPHSVSTRVNDIHLLKDSLTELSVNCVAVGG